MKKRAFTIIELLAVVGAIAIIAAILAPAAGAARDAARRSASKAQLCQYAAAFERFRAEYGHYPSMGSESARIDLRKCPRIFVETLSGRGFEGGEMTEGLARRSNPRSIAFHQFTHSEINADGFICDAFGNDALIAVVDRDGDGMLMRADFGAPAPEGLPEKLRASVAFFTMPGNGSTRAQTVRTWE